MASKKQGKKQGVEARAGSLALKKLNNLDFFNSFKINLAATHEDSST